MKCLWCSSSIIMHLHDTRTFLRSFWGSSYSSPPKKILNNHLLFTCRKLNKMWKCAKPPNLSLVSSKSTTGQFQSDLSGDFSREEEAWHEPSARPRASLWIFCKQKHFGTSPVKVIPAVVLTALILCSEREDKNHTTWTKGGKKGGGGEQHTHTRERGY